MQIKLKKKKDGNQVIVIDGDINIHHVKKIHEELLKLIPEMDAISLEIINTKELDLTGCQLIYTLQEKCIKEKKQFHCLMNLEGSSKNLLEITGISNILTNNNTIIK
ncbi:MAG: STAS domain-containing protein [Bacteroidota bacterium]